MLASHQFPGNFDNRLRTTANYQNAFPRFLDKPAAKTKIVGTKKSRML